MEDDCSVIGFEMDLKSITKINIYILYTLFSTLAVRHVPAKLCKDLTIYVRG